LSLGLVNWLDSTEQVKTLHALKISYIVVEIFFLIAYIAIIQQHLIILHFPSKKDKHYYFMAYAVISFKTNYTGHNKYE